MENKAEELHELSESIYVSSYASDWKDSDDIAEQLYNIFNVLKDIRDIMKKGGAE